MSLQREAILHPKVHIMLSEYWKFYPQDMAGRDKYMKILWIASNFSFTKSGHPNDAHKTVS